MERRRHIAGRISTAINLKKRRRKMENRGLIVVFGAIFFPVILIGVTAWLLWTALAVGWNALDAIAEEMF